MPAALVTGVSHRRGIGFAIARRLLADGFDVLLHSLPEPEPEVAEALGEVPVAVADLADPAAPAALVAEAVDRFGRLDVLVVNHARSRDMALEDVTAEELDLTWAVNARAGILLVQAFAAQASEGGRVILFTSGQHLAPMAGELPYAVSKGAIHQMTRSLADALADLGVTVNAVNPGPVDTGWPDDDLREALRSHFPAGRWGRPEDIAAVVAFLASAESAWITGQVIDAEGGFRRHLGVSRSRYPG